MTEDGDDRRRRRLVYRSTHRGTREADFIFGGFVQAHLAELSPRQVAWLERLMSESDPDLMAWIASGTPPKRYDTELFQLILQFKNNRQTIDPENTCSD